MAKAPVGPIVGRRQAGKPAVAQAPIQAAHGPRALPGALMLPLDQIVPDPEQPRRTFDPASLAELSDSIARQGILQPLLVREDGYVDNGRVRYVIVAGERRWRAAQAAGLDAAPVIVRGSADVNPADAQELRVLQLIENLQRADLSAIEEARALHELQAARDLSVRHLAALVSRPATYVQNRLALVTLARDEVVAHAVESGRLTPSAAVEIQALPEPQREAVLGRVRTDPTYAPDVAALRRLKQQTLTPTPAVPNRNTQGGPSADTRGVDHQFPQPPANDAQEAQRAAEKELAAALTQGDVQAVIAYGVARGWTCAQLQGAIDPLQSRLV